MYLLFCPIIMDQHISIFYIVTNLFAIASALLSMRWPTIARVLFGSMFICAAVANCYIATSNPAAYLSFGELTPSSLYRLIILGPFAEHVQLYVLIIAACQLFIGIFTCYRGPLMSAAMIGAIVFLIAIAPFGEGSAFPSTLIMAIAFLILLWKKIDVNIYGLLSNKMKYSER